MLPTWPNDTPFRRKGCSESILLSDRVKLSSAEARVKGIVGGSVWAVELFQNIRYRRRVEGDFDNFPYGPASGLTGPPQDQFVLFSSLGLTSPRGMSSFVSSTRGSPAGVPPCRLFPGAVRRDPCPPFPSCNSVFEKRKRGPRLEECFSRKSD